MKVCVVGAGAAGLCAVRHFCRLPQFFTVSVIEPATHVGGVWMNDDDRNVANQLYVNLTRCYYIFYSFILNRTNLPKEIIAFPDFHFDPHLPSFVSFSDIGQYLVEYTEHFQLMPHIQFNTAVISVVQNKMSYKSQVPGDKQYPESELLRKGFVFDQWNVTTQNIQTKQITTEIYDAVLICDWYFIILCSTKH